MSKKKKHKHAEQRAQDHGHGDDRVFHVPPQIAGIAAMVVGQAASPTGRKLIANALNAAAEAIAGRDGVRASSPVRPEPPVPPVPSMPPIPPVPPIPSVAPEPQAAYAPKFESPNFTLPPEAARAIGAAASALERWAQGLGKPKPPES